MTKFILHGGETSKPSTYNRNFFEEIVKSSKEPLQILLVYFARKKDQWLGLFNNDTKKLSIACPKKKFKFILAKDDINTLINQISSSDIIYISGGRDFFRLRKLFSKIDNLHELFQDKIIAGSSAGSYVLAKYYYSNSKDRVIKGLGLLNIKVFCHYNRSKTEKLEKLENYGEKLTVYTIPETKYVIIEK